MAKILIVIPHDRFRDEELQALMTELDASEHTYNIGSTHHTEAKGQYGLLVKPDVELKYVEVGDYDCIVLLGGAGVQEFVSDSFMTGLVARFYYDRKLIAAIGMAVEILAYAGILTQKRVTCDSLTASKVTDAGAYFTGAGTEWDGDVLTGSGYRASEEFAKELVKGLKS
jgi:protease I